MLPIIHHPAYEVDLGPHVFPTAKYRLMRARLIAEGTIAESEIILPEAATDADVRLVHTEAYVGKLRSGRLSYQEELTLEMPFSEDLRDAMWLCAGGAMLTARKALDHGLAVHLGGGFHHAYPDHGEGFCLINDVAIALRRMLGDGAVSRALVVDLDVHHGNGTAAVFAREPAVFTFSMHQEHNYPAHKPPSDLDLGLPDGTGDEEYLALLERHLAEIVVRHQPQLAFYLAGADPYEHDQLGGLALTIGGLRRRDALVYRLLTSAGVPVAVTLAGGYAIRQQDTVEIHCNSVREAKRIASAPA